MKLLLTFILFHSFINLICQELPTRLTYTNSLIFNTDEDSVRYYSVYKNLPAEVQQKLSIPAYEEYLINKDTTLIFWYPKKVSPPTYLFISTKSKLERIDVYSGKIIEFEDNTERKYLNFNTYKRISEEDQVILDKKCEAWISSSKNGWNKVWLTNANKQLIKKVGEQCILNNQLVFKQITYNKKRGTVRKEITQIKELEEKKIGKIIAEHSKVDIKPMYQLIPQNSKYENKPIKVGSIAPNLYYRKVFNNEMGNIYNLTSKSKYTIIEFWGSWCIPCLVANGWIKSLHEQYDNNHLAILSLDVYDRQIEKVHSLIKQKQMTWNQGYATEKWISIFNKQDTYPWLVIINQENKVMYTGNPGREDEKKQIIDILDQK
nr:TlpA disulfide reductase family protein [uncultured Carboxylicivirga sp.]